MVLEPVQSANPTDQFYRTATPHLSRVTPTLGNVIRCHVDVRTQEALTIVEDEFDM